MQLIGMLDSPYVRRVAISLELMGITFEHKAVSVFANFDEFKSINPVVKAPTLICDNQEVLMDSGLILEYASALAPSNHSLMPTELVEKQHALRLIGLALVANEKTVQVLYEKEHRPSETLYQPWLDRLMYQMRAAFSAIEVDLSGIPLQAGQSLASITIAVAWRFNQIILTEKMNPQEYPLLQELSERSEKLPAFLSYPPSGSSQRTSMKAAMSEEA